MFAILSLLDAESEARVFELWRVLESTCGFQRNRITPIPHLSWQVAEDYPVAGIKDQLRILAKSTKPFTVQTAGIGLFTETIPVVYLNVVMSETVNQFHRRVWQVGEPFATSLSGYYQPDAWVPHITLSYGEVTPENLGCALGGLAFKPLKMNIQIRNIALASQESDQTGRVHKVYEFHVQ